MWTVIGFLARYTCRRPWSPICRTYCRNFSSSSSSAVLTRESLFRRYTEAGLYDEVIKHGFFHHTSQSELEKLNEELVRLDRLSIFENLVTSTWGTKRLEPNLKSHTQLVELLDADKSTWRSNLHGALVDLAWDFMDKTECHESKIHFFSREDVEEKFGGFENFGRRLYWVSCEGTSHTAYPMCDDVALSDDEFCHAIPFSYAVFSSCSRGKAGVTRGHDTYSAEDVEKVEFFRIADGFINLELGEMIASCEEFYKMLEIPFRVVASRYGAWGDPLVKFVIEGWFPASQTYEELASCLAYNVSDIQYRGEKSNEGLLEFVCTIHCNLAVMERTMGCMLENHQREGGITVLPCLRQYMDGESSILPLMT